MLLIEVKKYSGDDPVHELFSDLPFDGFVELVANTDKNSLKEVLTMINGRHPDIVDLILDYLVYRAPALVFTGRALNYRDQALFFTG